jgi:sugar phosphate isomerase/epimerase
MNTRNRNEFLPQMNADKRRYEKEVRIWLSSIALMPLFGSASIRVHPRLIPEFDRKTYEQTR